MNLNKKFEGSYGQPAGTLVTANGQAVAFFRGNPRLVIRDLIQELDGMARAINAPAPVIEVTQATGAPIGGLVWNDDFVRADYHLPPFGRG